MARGQVCSELATRYEPDDVSVSALLLQVLWNLTAHGLPRMPRLNYLHAAEPPGISDRCLVLLSTAKIEWWDAARLQAAVAGATP